ncbi:MAG: hypothetical protein HY706_22555 [Candidatus Hydrogenedentes bacterium]|nr:hypothetical protein [Candidatus Hydrogenedentota bacterium]
MPKKSNASRRAAKPARAAEEFQYRVVKSASFLREHKIVLENGRIVVKDVDYPWSGGLIQQHPEWQKVEKETLLPVRPGEKLRGKHVRTLKLVDRPKPGEKWEKETVYHGSEWRYDFFLERLYGKIDWRIYDACVMFYSMQELGQCRMMNLYFGYTIEGGLKREYRLADDDPYVKFYLNEAKWYDWTKGKEGLRTRKEGGDLRVYPRDFLRSAQEQGWDSLLPSFVVDYASLLPELSDTSAVMPTSKPKAPTGLSLRSVRRGQILDAAKRVLEERRDGSGDVQEFRNSDGKLIGSKLVGYLNDKSHQYFRSKAMPLSLERALRDVINPAIREGILQ